jgi:ANTAR domain/GAF domain
LARRRSPTPHAATSSAPSSPLVDAGVARRGAGKRGTGRRPVTPPERGGRACRSSSRYGTRPTAYTAHVAQRGVLSSLSVPLPIQTDVIGALNCYSQIPSAFPAEAIEVAEELAGHLAVAVGNAVAYTNASTLVEQMRTAMVGRSVIDHAMGIVMAQNRCDAKAAFAVHTRASQNRNVKLREIARSIVTDVSQRTAR